MAKDRLIQLAKNYKDLSPKAKIAAFAAGGYVSEKLDGVWMAAKRVDGVVTFLSSTREEYISFNETDVEADIKYMHHPTMQDFVLIGEAYNSSMEQAVINGFANTETVGAADELFFRVHDVVTVDEFEAGICSRSFEERLAILDALVVDINCDAVWRVPQTYISKPETFERMAQDIITHGGEGACYKPLHAGWEAGNRGTNLIRIKEKITFDLEVSRVGEVSEGDKGGLKGVIYVWFKPFGNPEQKSVELPIRGMKFPQLKAWADDPSLIVGKIVEVHAMKYTGYGLLREPVFKSVRTDKHVGDF